MALTATFIADFSSFTTAVNSAVVKLKDLDTGAAKVGTSLTRMAESFSGRKVIQDANLITEAVTRMGGASKLTESEQARVNARVTEAIAKYQALGQTAPPTMLALAAATKQAAEPTVALSVAVGQLAAQLVVKAAGAITDFGKEALLSSARVESLGSVARFLGTQSGLSAAGIDALVMALRRQGITSQQANDTVIQLTRSNLGLADATKLATVAQSLARATGQNSSETMGQLIRGVQTLQVETLRNAGVVIQLDQEYKKFAETNNRTVESLGAQEKQQIALAAALREGAKVAGVYGVTNENVGGKIQSLSRHQEEAAKAMGDVFLPALRLGTEGLTGFYQVVQKAPDVFAGLGLGIVGVGTAFTVFRGAAVLGVVSTTTMTAAMGLLAPAVAVAATAFAAWKIGSWVGEFSGLTDAVERLTGRMMGLSSADIEAGMAARKYAESAQGKSAQLKAQEEALRGLEEASRRHTTAELARAKAEAEAVIAKEKALEKAKAAAKELDTLTQKLSGADALKASAQWVAALARITTGFKDAGGGLNEWAKGQQAVSAATKLSVSDQQALVTILKVSAAEFAKRGREVPLVERMVLAALEDSTAKQRAMMNDINEARMRYTAAEMQAAEDYATQQRAIINEVGVAQRNAEADRMSDLVKNAERERAILNDINVERMKQDKIVRDGALTVRKSLDGIAESMVQLAQVSGDSFGGIVQDIAKVVVAVNAAAKAGQDYRNSTGLSGRATAVFSAALAVNAAASERGAKGILDAATAGAVFGSTFGPLGTVLGGAAGAVVGLIHNMRGLSDEVKAALAEFGKFEEQIRAVATSEERVEANGRAWALNIIVLRNALITTGRNGDEAVDLIKGALDAAYISSEALKESMLRINAAMREAAEIKAFEDDFLGTELIDRANKMAKAIENIGGLSGLNASKLRQLHDTVAAAIEQYALLGQTAPASLLELKRATEEAIAAAAFKDAFATDDVIERAEKLTSAINALGGVTALSGDQMQQLHIAVQLAIDKYKAMGKEVPPELQKILDATGDNEQQMKKLADAEIKAKYEAEKLAKAGSNKSATQATKDWESAVWDLQRRMQDQYRTMSTDGTSSAKDIRDAMISMFDEFKSSDIAKNMTPEWKRLVDDALRSAQNIERAIESIRPRVSVDFDYDTSGAPSYASRGGLVTPNGIQYMGTGGSLWPSRGSDVIPAMLTPGERVLSVAQNKAYEQGHRGGSDLSGLEAEFREFMRQMAQRDRAMPHMMAVTLADVLAQTLRR